MSIIIHEVENREYNISQYNISQDNNDLDIEPCKRLLAIETMK